MRFCSLKKRIISTFISIEIMCSISGCTIPGKEKKENNVTEKEISTEVVTEAVTETTEEIPTTTEVQHDIRTLTITATGDCALGPIQTHGYGGSFHEYYDNYGEGYFLQNFKELFEADDFTLVNLECALTDRPFYPESNPDKEFFIVGRPEYAGILSSAGVEGCSLGNNHSKDVGTAGLEDTEAACDSAGIKWAVDDVSAIYETEDGYTIGFASSLLTGPVERENYIRNAIQQFNEQDVDIIVACCHWGEEKEYYPTDYQKRLAHEFVDLGADLIIGNHPHVVQGVEYYNGKVICYSLGNFCFGASHHPYDMEDMVFQQTFTFVDGELRATLDAHIIPVRVSTDASNNDFQPVYLEGEEKSSFIERVNTYSEACGNVEFDENGKLLVDYGDVMSDDGSNASEDGTVIYEDDSESENPEEISDGENDTNGNPSNAADNEASVEVVEDTEGNE